MCVAVTPLSDHVVELGYPIPLAGTTAPSAKDLSQPVPPISVSLVIPDFVLVSSSTPEIGWWDEASLLFTLPANVFALGTEI